MRSLPPGPLKSKQIVVNHRFLPLSIHSVCVRSGPPPFFAPVEERKEVEAQSAVFARDLRLPDLVLSQITMVVGSTWVGTAGKLGRVHPFYWIFAGGFFFVPLAVVVVFLNRRMALEGGLYQWAKYGLGEVWGFLVAYNLWVYTIVILSSLGLETTTFLSYAFGPRAVWMAESRPFIAVFSVALMATLAVLTAAGLRLGRWLHDLGGMARLVAYAAILALAAAAFFSGRLPSSHAAAVAAPVFSLYSLNILGKMGFGAFSGFEYMAIFAGESPDPARSISRSVVIAAPIVLLMFTLGTASVLAFVPPAEIDLIAPIPQAISRGAAATFGAGFLAPFVAIVLVLGNVGYGAAAFAGITRLPMVAGWDGLLPAWFSKLHPVRRTPTHSILFVAAATLAIGLGGTAGVGSQEAYQLLGSVALILYALTYLAMFAIPLAAPTFEASRAVKIAAASGFAMTLLFIVLSVFPIVKTESDAAFTVKVILGIVVSNVVGVGIYLFNARRSRRRHRGPAASA
jgi:glutamate:GABA antiporter